MINRTFEFAPQAQIVNGERVRQAREMAGLTQSKLSKLARVSQAMIAHVESGLKQPSFELTALIASRTGVPTEFLFKPSGPSLPQGPAELFFRARAGVSAKKLNQARALAERAFEIYLELATQFDLPTVKLRPLPGNPALAAREARSMLSVGPQGPIAHLIRAFEIAGGVVITMPEFGDREAFAVWAGERPVIGVAPTRFGDRLRFSVAHEIGHLLLHLQPVSRVEAERDAHSFAAELLMPSESFASEINGELTLGKLGSLKLKWGVSMSSILMRTRELDIISRRQFEGLIKLMASKGILREEPPHLSTPIEKPRALRQMAEAVYGQHLNYSKMAIDFSLTTEFLRQMMSQYASQTEVKGKPNTPKIVDINSRRI